MKKIREMTTVLHYLAFDNFEFTRKMRYFWIIAKNNRTCFPNFRNFENQEQRTKTYLKSSANKAKSKGFFANFLVTCTKGQKRPKSFMFKEPLMLSIGCLRKDWQENGLRSLRRCKKRKLHNSWSSLWPSKAVKAGAASATQRTREFTSRPLEAFFARV